MAVMGPGGLFFIFITCSIIRLHPLSVNEMVIFTLPVVKGRLGTVLTIAV